MSRRTAVIIGAGPSGLTAAYELLVRTDIRVIVIEKSDDVGGISRTVKYKGNYIDIGGHRFFSKSDRVMEWWLKMLPLQSTQDTGQLPPGLSALCESPDLVQGLNPDEEDRVMLIRKRKSRIYYLHKFFDYPISLSINTLKKLGFVRSIRIVLSYIKSFLFPIRNEENLEQFFINRFGKNLYTTFFKSYTEKLWGVPCKEIASEWGAQRVKGLSITKAITHAFQGILKRHTGYSQKRTETSLIARFLYPKYGPGQMWEEVARRIVEKGGEIFTGLEVDAIHAEGDRIKVVETVDTDNGERGVIEGDYFFSSMPVKELTQAMKVEIPKEIAEIGKGLIYRSFIIVGLLLKRLSIADGKKKEDSSIEDQWIYIQEPGISAGRLQLFNNWSPYLVADPNKAWIGLEYFCDEEDELWDRSDQEMVCLAVEELEKMAMIGDSDLLDATVIHMPKAYPAYFGTYQRFNQLKYFFNRFENLFMIGRNGMHRYNNQDHSMLTAMIAVDNIVEGRKDKSNIWAVNIEEEYLESK